MKLTDKTKQYIDSLSYERLLLHWRFAPVGDKWFEGETGEYWTKRMSELRNLPNGENEHVRASKAIEW
jgi:hypothetical protein